MEPERVVFILMAWTMPATLTICSSWTVLSSPISEPMGTTWVPRSIAR